MFGKRVAPLTQRALPQRPMEARSGSERLDFVDPETGRTVWRLTNSPYHDKHAYYDVSPWSPDGAKILFSSVDPADLEFAVAGRSRPPSEKRAVSRRGHIFRMNSDGTCIERLAGDAPFCAHIGSFPLWVPGRDLIVYGGQWDDFAEDTLHIMNLATREVTVFKGLFGRHVSPDGSLLACQSADGIVMLPLDAPAERRVVVRFADVARALPHRDPALFDSWNMGNIKWSPRGDRFLFRFFAKYQGEPASEVVVAAPDGTDITILPEASVRLHHPSWCPDGERILYGDVVDGEARLFIHPLGGPRSLLTDERLGGHPLMSPDGTRVVTDVSKAKFGEEKFGSSLVLVDVATGSVEKLVSTPHTFYCDPHAVWSPDGSRILYDCSATGTSQIYVVPL